MTAIPLLSTDFAVPFLGIASSLIGTARRVRASRSWSPCSTNTPIDTMEEKLDNSLVIFERGKILWENARAAGRHQPL